MKEIALDRSEDEMAAAFKHKDQLRYEEFLRVIGGKTTGAARVSMALANTFAYVSRFGTSPRVSGTPRPEPRPRPVPPDSAWGAPL